MAGTTFFFTGANEYQLQSELLRWKKEFREKHGDENLLTVDGPKEKFLSLMDIVSAMPFIAEKRLVISRGVPKLEKDDMIHLLDAVHPDAIFVIAEPKPDKRLSAVKVIEEHATKKDFPAMNAKKLSEWAMHEVAASGLRSDAFALQVLIDLTSGDPRMISTELRKLSLASPDGTLTEELVRSLTLPSGERVVWELTNLLTRRNISGTLTFLWEQIDRGENPYSLWTVLVDMIRKVIAVWACLQAGFDGTAVARELKMHPFVVQNMLPFARALTEKDARRLSALAVRYDTALKTGELKVTSDAPEEVIAASQRLILACA